MRRLGLSSRTGIPACVSALLAAVVVPAALLAQPVTREGSRWVQTITGTTPAAARLRVNTQGPVHLEANAAREITYTAKLSVQAPNEGEARRLLTRFSLRVVSTGALVVLAAPGGPVTANLSIKAPRLNGATITTLEGDVEANGVDGPLDLSSEAGELKCDRIRGDGNLSTGGGDIRVGQVGGELRCATAGGRITVRKVGGEAVLQTAGGYIEVIDAGAGVRADTGGGPSTSPAPPVSWQPAPGAARSLSAKRVAW